LKFPEVHFRGATQRRGRRAGRALPTPCEDRQRDAGSRADVNNAGRVDQTPRQGGPAHRDNMPFVFSGARGMRDSHHARELIQMLRQLLQDETGAIVSIEIVLIVTIMVLGLIVGMSEVAVAVNNELNDISNAVGSLKQDYAFTGFASVDGAKTKSFTSGSDTTTSPTTAIATPVAISSAARSAWSGRNS